MILHDTYFKIGKIMTGEKISRRLIFPRPRSAARIARFLASRDRHGDGKGEKNSLTRETQTGKSDQSDDVFVFERCDKKFSAKLKSNCFTTI